MKIILTFLGLLLCIIVNAQTFNFVDNRGVIHISKQYMPSDSATVAKNSKLYGDTSYYAIPVDSSWFFGTSVTAGAGITVVANSPSFTRYVDVVAMSINTYPVNKGIGGTSMRVGSTGDSSMVERIPIIPIKLSTRRYLSFEYGYNDATTADTAGFRSSLNKVLDSATIARGWPTNKIILIPAAYRINATASAARDTFYRSVMRSIATERGCMFADTYTPTSGNASILQTDGTHPNAYGHSELARAILSILPEKKSGFAYATGILSANALSVDGSIRMPVNDTAVIANIAGNISLTKNNQVVIGARFFPITTTNSFTGSTTYAADFRGHILLGNSKNIFGVRTDAVSFAILGLDASNNMNFSQSNTQTYYYGNSLHLNYRNNMDWTDNNSGSKTLTMFATSGNMLLQTAGTHTDDAANKLQVTGSIKSSQYRISAMNTAPSSATDTGTLGEIRITSTFIYVCTATNIWVRTALATW